MTSYLAKNKNNIAKTAINKSLWPLLKALVGSVTVVLGLLTATQEAAGTDVYYRWAGGTDTNWLTGGNWVLASSDSAPVGTPMPHSGITTNRLEVESLGANDCFYNFPGDAVTNAVDGSIRGFVLYSGNLHIRGGAFTSLGLSGGWARDGADLIGNAAGSSGLIVDGGNFMCLNLTLGYATSTNVSLIISNGTANVSVLYIGGGVANSVNRIGLDGGTLTVCTNVFYLSNGSNIFQFNGGTLTAGANSANFLPPAADTAVIVSAGGAYINDGGNTVIIGAVLAGDPNSAGGGLTKLGGGTVTLTNANTYSGPTSISAGTLILSGSGSLSDSTITLNNGAIFDISALTNGYLLADDEVFNCSGVVNGSFTSDYDAKIYPGGDGTYGTNTFNGNLTVNLGSFCVFDVGTKYNGSNDLIVVNGNLVNNGIVHLRAPSTTVNLDTNCDYVLMVASNLISTVSQTPVWDVAPLNATNFTLIVAGNNLQLHYTQPFVPILGGVYRIEDQFAGNTLLSHTGYTNYPLALSTWDTLVAWQFSFITNGAGYYQILCLNNNASELATCEAGSSCVYQQTNYVTDGNLWEMLNVGQGYVSFINKLNGNALTFDTTQTEPVFTTNYTGSAQQNFWVDVTRITPEQLIAVPPGYHPSMPKLMILCSSNNQGGSITGALASASATNMVTFCYTSNNWLQYYYSYTDSNFCNTQGWYTISAPGFNPAQFFVTSNYYYRVPNRIGAVQVKDIISGFFNWTRESSEYPDTNMAEFFQFPGETNATYLGPISMPGGWKDATSPDMELNASADTLLNLAYAAGETLHTDDKAALLSEIAYEADFIVRFQNTNGSFRRFLFPGTIYEPGTVGEVLDNPDVGYCALACASLAASSSVLNGYSNTLAAQCIIAATNGWAWVEKNPTNFWPGAGGTLDDVVAGASEMYRIFSATNYYSDLTNLFANGTVTNSGDFHTLFTFSHYCMNAGPSSIKTSMMVELTNLWNNLLVKQLAPFGTTPTGGAGRAQEYIDLYAALGNPLMLTAACNDMNWALGANPFNTSCVIGFGYLNIVPQYGRPRPGSIGALPPTFGYSTNGSLTCEGGYTGGESVLSGAMPEALALMDNICNCGFAPIFLDTRKLLSNAKDHEISPDLLIARTNAKVSSQIFKQVLLLSWPASYLGWILQAQTNVVGVGTNWVDVPDSSSNLNETIIFDPGQPPVFFRLRQP